jgi:hypothetical protein
LFVAGHNVVIGFTVAVVVDAVSGVVDVRQWRQGLGITHELSTVVGTHELTVGTARARAHAAGGAEIDGPTAGWNVFVGHAVAVVVDAIKRAVTDRRGRLGDGIADQRVVFADKRASAETGTDAGAAGIAATLIDKTGVFVGLAVTVVVNVVGRAVLIAERIAGYR